jgi:hypothetical protein
MSEQKALVLRTGFIGTCALVALVLLATFYSTVSGAVDRAAKQRVAARPGSASTAAGLAARQQPRANALFARVGD